MLIRVKYSDNRYDMVRPEVLDHLLDYGAVAEFKRCDGWVKSSDDSVRRYSRNEYPGTDRREQRQVSYRK